MSAGEVMFSHGHLMWLSKFYITENFASGQNGWLALICDTLRREIANTRIDIRFAKKIDSIRLSPGVNQCPDTAYRN